MEAILEETKSDHVSTETVNSRLQDRGRGRRDDDIVE